MRNSASFAIGIDVGGTKVAAGLVDEQGAILARDRREVAQHDPESIAEAIAAMATGLRDEARARGADLAGVGVGLPGFVSADGSVARMVPNLGWRDVPFRALLEQRLGMPATIDNDANVAAWAEYRFGAALGFHHVVLITVGTGVGGGLVVNDHLLRGGAGMAAEVGHINLVPGGRRCGCGRLGCWEQYASGNALVRYAREGATERRDEARHMLSLGDGTPEGIIGRHVTQAAREGDAVAVAAFAELGQRLGEGLADLVVLFDPEVIVIGGGVSEAGDLLMQPLESSLRSSMVTQVQRDGIAVRLASLRNDAGIIGAADIVRVH